MSDEKINVHKNHRKRMRDKYEINGIDAFYDHEKLEFLLYNAIPRVNTNPIAHELLKKFGSIKGVLGADPQELMEVSGIGEGCVNFLKFINDLFNYIIREDLKKPIVLNNINTIGEYIVPFFSNLKNEVLYIFFLDKGNRMKGYKKLSEGGLDSLPIETADVVRAASVAQAYKVILAHNHPGGELEASGSDIDSTRVIKRALLTVNIGLYEHFIVSDGNYLPICERYNV